MKYRNLLCSACLASLLLSGAAFAQQPAKVRKPVKNPPQYPHIIDLEGQAAPPATQTAPPTSAPATAPAAPAAVAPSDALVLAVQSLAGEVRTLVGEIRALNLRQQAQLELTRMTRLDLRIDHYERELKPLRERLAALEVEEQNLNQLMSRESLLAQTATVGTLDRDATMRQVRQQHEYRLRLVQNEKERLQRQEADLAKELAVIRSAGAETELRIKQTEELLKGNPNQP